MGVLEFSNRIVVHGIAQPIHAGWGGVEVVAHDTPDFEGLRFGCIRKQRKRYRFSLEHDLL